MLLNPRVDVVFKKKIDVEENKDILLINSARVKIRKGNR